jgi:fatty-acyl-CoA synthase
MDHEPKQDWLRFWFQQEPHRIAFIDGRSQKRWSYRDTLHGVSSICVGLKNKGLKSGDRIALLAQNKLEMVFLFLACQRLGICLVPINYRLTTVEISEILEDAQVSLVFADPGLVKDVESSHTVIDIETLTTWIDTTANQETITPFLSSNQTVVMLLYTSGTTGRPKGVMITQEMLFWNSLNTSLSLDITSQDVSVSFLPLFHTGGWNVLLTPFIHRGAKTIFLPGFNPEEVLDWIEKESATILFGVPTTLNMMAQAEQFQQTNLSSLRFAVVGGEPMPLSAIKQWHARKVWIRQGFGMTECGPNLFSLHHRLAEKKVGSIGKPNIYVEWRLVNKSGADVEPGDVGELWLKGPVLTPGYYNYPHANELAFEQGWFKSGDLLRYDDDGDFYVVGRKKDMYISGGENVYPAEVERVIGSHPDVIEAAVIGKEHDKWGEVGHAFVVAKHGLLSKAALAEFCQQHLAKFKVPQDFTFIDSLPKTDSNKIQKRKLKELI